MGYNRQCLGLALWLLVIVVSFGIGLPGSAQASFVFSHREDSSYGGIVATDHSLVETDGAGSYWLYATGLASALPPEVNIDAADLLSGGRVVFSLAEDAVIGGTLYADEDLLLWDGASINLFWDGSANGLPPEVNLDAVDVVSESPLEFDFSLEEDAVLPGPGLVADEDVVDFTAGSGFSASLVFDGSAAGVPPEANLDGFSRLSDTLWLISFDSAVEIGLTLYDDADVLEYDSSGGTWSLYFDASAQGIPGEVDLDAVSFVPTPTPTPTPTATPTPTPTPVVFVKEYTFDASTEGWTFIAPSNPSYSGATSGWGAGRISISSANDATNRVGLFSGPLDIPYVAGNVYRAIFTVTSSQATASANPQMRLRWIQDQSLESTSLVLNASGSFSNSLPVDPTTKDYTIYFAPILSGSMGVAFDMLDFSPAQSGTHYVDLVVVERFPVPALGTAVKTYTDTADFSNWQFITNISPYGPVTSGVGTGTLSIASDTTAASNFGWWQCSGTANELTYVANELFRATFTLRCASDPARNVIPQVRLRCQNEDGQMTQTMELNSQGTGPGAMPEVAGTDYEVYWETPALPGLPSPTEDGFIVTLDVLDFDAAKGGTIYLDSVMVDYLAIP
jgi:hypothetical protein